jgi:DHA1 family tetracycline resistance protein-like MFS transporter
MNHRNESTKRSRRKLLSIRTVCYLSVAVLLLFGVHDAAAIRKPSSTLNCPENIVLTATDEKRPKQQQTFSSANTPEGLPRGGKLKFQKQPQPPSIYWAILHNWLYFLSLGFNVLNIPYMIREIVDGKLEDGTLGPPSSQAIALSGNVEAVDKILTFCGIAFLSALSDKHGRRPLIAWSSFGFCLTNLLQAFACKAPTQSSSKLLLYLADFVDGCSSCMTPVCQAYVADCTTGSSSLASNLGIFQGISIGGAFILAFPIGGLLGAKFGPRLPILLAAGFQLLNGLLATFVTPEPNKAATEKAKNSKTIALSEVNPIAGLQNLLGIAGGNGFRTSSVGLLRTAALTYFFLSLARGSLDAQFVNYSNLRFGWTQAQSGPVLVMTGFMLAIVPRILVPLLGLQKAINLGLLVYALGLSSAGLVDTSGRFVLSIVVVAIGCGE